MKKNDLKKIKIEDICSTLPELKNSSVSKATIISKWLISWIEKNLDCGNISETDLLPTKAEFAFMLGVSIGTIQNALRFTEDAGYVESKQRIGTIIKNKDKTSSIRKLTSKREITIEKIKKLIISENYSENSQLPSSRNLAKLIDSSPNTTRLALEFLCNEGIIEHKLKNSDDAGWIVKTTKFDIQELHNEQKTLVCKIEKDLKNYISDNLKIGDKLPAHEELAKTLNTSIKTVHDALKTLTDEGIILPRRGRYGTSVVKMPYDRNIDIAKETSIFAKAKDTAFYYYEKTQNHIKKIISENYSIGDRLPSIMELSKEMDLSPNTIRKAFQNLADEGYLTFARGRYGGTFVIDIPETESQAFKWLAVSPSYTKIEN